MPRTCLEKGINLLRHPGNGKHQNKTAAGHCVDRKNHLAAHSRRVKRLRSLQDAPGKRPCTLPKMQAGHHGEVQHRGGSRVAGKKQRSLKVKTRTTCYDENETGKLCSKNDENDIHFILKQFAGKQQKRPISARADKNKI